MVNEMCARACDDGSLKASVGVVRVEWNISVLRDKWSDLALHSLCPRALITMGIAHPLFSGVHNE